MNLLNLILTFFSFLISMDRDQSIFHIRVCLFHPCPFKNFASYSGLFSEKKLVFALKETVSRDFRPLVFI
jgi:hypothetical protein